MASRIEEVNIMSTIIEEQVSDRLSPGDLNLGILRVLAETGKEMRAGEVAAALGVTTPQLCHAIIHLKANQMIIKRTNASRNTWLRLPFVAISVPPVRKPIPVLEKLAPKWIPQWDLVRLFETMMG